MARTLKLSDLQLILLSTAAQRPEGNLLPAADSIADQTDRIRKAIPALLKRELIIEADTADVSSAWREEEDRQIGVIVTEAGRGAIAAEEGSDGGKPKDAPTTEVEPPAPPTPPTALEPAAAPAKRVTKAEHVVTLLARADGATLAELTEATGWLPHTTRAALTGLRKKGYVIAKNKRGEETCYKIGAAA